MCEIDFGKDNSIFPQKLMVEVSTYCNHSCLFCAHRFSKRKQQFIDDKIAYRVIKEAAQMGIKEVGFHGMGEPLTNPNLCQYISYAKECDIPYTYIDTNGVLANPDVLENLLKSGLDSIKFSISAYDKETYKQLQGKDDLEKVLKNLDYVVEAKKRYDKLKIYIDFVSCKLNKGQEDGLISDYKDLVDDIWISPLVNQGGNMYGRLEDLSFDVVVSEGLLCREPFDRIVVTAEGYVTSCCMDNDNRLKYADLCDSKLTLNEIWFCGNDIRKAHLSGENLPSICRLCDMKKMYEIDT